MTLNWKKVAPVLALAVVAAFVLWPRPVEDVRRSWTGVLRACAGSDQIGGTLFLGFSNNIGLGAVWKPNATQGGYDPIRPWPEFQGRDAIDTLGTPVPCEGAAHATSELAADVAGDLAGMIPASLGGSAAWTDSIVFSTEGWAWDHVWITLFADWVNGEGNESFRGTLENGGLVAGRVLRLEGFNIDLVFNTERSAELRADFPEGLEEAGVSGRWVGDRRVRLSSPERVYVVAQLYAWNPTEGLASTRSLDEVDLPEGARAAGTAMPGGEL